VGGWLVSRIRTDRFVSADDFTIKHNTKLFFRKIQVLEGGDSPKLILGLVWVLWACSTCHFNTSPPTFVMLFCPQKMKANLGIRP